ncbi:hypothetical protein [Streptomyces sp. NBC_00620]|uniref:hypothetical protein n=1 Tax=unclassified Streptomyces TaxID=2593676 RepID=UPI00225444F5|nr:hypothetical protein [Streptomyces sp. NBC_00620]MCX4973127.1 hypothetical protein [Streptomyces sp. NBC_00620]WUC12427.1 hypothetical protein OG256_22265 [Streptomyces sp. NBC_00564]WUC51063.1 hypothetical protein OG266_22745 [Streptomyces sp. NBC_00554]
MRTRQKSRVFTLLAASALLAGGSLTVGATNAAAADWTFSKSAVSDNGSFSITSYYNGTYAGAMVWNADPGCCGIPGDAFQVVDVLSDGRGMEAKMVSPVTGRVATTRGHAATYTSPWNTGDLTEGTAVYIQLCAVVGTYADCSLGYSGRA